MKKRVSLRLAALGAAAALVLTACGSEDSSSQEVTETSAVTTVQTTAATVASAPETVTETQTTVWEEPPLPEPRALPHDDRGRARAHRRPLQ